jgi:demethylmenaquinone methyltransferase/2-methoxy-6-polyprenyl-1,4-benzoquinol methylase
VRVEPFAKRTVSLQQAQLRFKPGNATAAFAVSPLAGDRRSGMESGKENLAFNSATTKQRVAGSAGFGVSPGGVQQDEDAAAASVRQMFTAIAPRYDLLNHLLSFNIDKLWWRRTARVFADVLGRSEARALDLCCGTGDMTFSLLRQANRGKNARQSVSPEKNAPRIYGVDFSHAMLVRALAKSAGGSIRWVEADALHLPFGAESFDLVTSAFGFRNLANYDAGLREIYRVLAPGGQVGILDFGEPGGVIGKLYRVYFRQVLPRIGTVLSGVSGPYAYLPASVHRFPPPAEMMERMRQAGFRETSWTPYTFGIAGLYRGRK